MELPDLIQLKFEGDGLSPSDIRLSELARLLRRFEDYVASQVHQSEGVPKEEVHISLNSIRHTSATYGVHAPMKDAALHAVCQFGRAVETNNFLGLDPSSRDLAKQIVSFTRRYNCRAHLVARTGKEDYVTTLTPETRVGSAKLIRGETQYYGVLERIGGAEPRFVLRVSTSEAIHGTTSIELAIELAHHLYSWVGVHGLATWDPISGDIEDFKITHVLPFKGIGIVKAMDLLKNAVGEYWDDEEDVAEAVSRIRGGGLP